MIKNLASSSYFLTVTNNYPPNIYNNGLLNTGQVRYNPNNQQLEVFDGNMWQAISSGVTVGLSSDADDAIRWAREKMQEERDLKIKLEKHPALKDAYDKFKMVEALVYEQE